jgi:hypothetical protein
MVLCYIIDFQSKFLFFSLQWMQIINDIPFFRMGKYSCSKKLFD